MFRFPSSDRPIILEKQKKKKKIPESRVNSCLKLLSILRFCSLFRHLIVLLIYTFYHLIISCRLNVRFNMQSSVHSFFFFCPTDRPTFTRGRAMGNGTFYGDGLSRNCLSVGCNSISEFHIIALSHEILYQTKCTRKLNLYKYEIKQIKC